jgi:hypothetical protein
MINPLRHFVVIRPTVQAHVGDVIAIGPNVTFTMVGDTVLYSLQDILYYSPDEVLLIPQANVVALLHRTADTPTPLEDIDTAIMEALEDGPLAQSTLVNMVRTRLPRKGINAIREHLTRMKLDGRLVVRTGPRNSLLYSKAEQK